MIILKLYIKSNVISNFNIPQKYGAKNYNFVRRNIFSENPTYIHFSLTHHTNPGLDRQGHLVPFCANLLMPKAVKNLHQQSQDLFSKEEKTSSEDI